MSDSTVPNMPYVISDPRRGSIALPLREAVRELDARVRRDPTDAVARQEAGTLARVMIHRFGNRTWRRFVMRCLRVRGPRGGAHSFSGQPFAPDTGVGRVESAS